MAVSVVGMFRSQATLLANVLALAGVDMGDPNDLLLGSSAEPEGRWEDYRFVDLNARLLGDLGGSWQRPPDLGRGWALRPELEDVRADASRLLGERKGTGPWGWKDPQTSLTHEFWKANLPDLNMVVALRDPLEVAQSLVDQGFRDGPRFSIDEGLQLWTTYNLALSSALDSPATLVVHVDSLLYDPAAELRRMFDFLGIEMSEVGFASALGAIRPELRRSLAPPRALPENIRALYLQLCSKAGPNYARSVVDEKFQESREEWRRMRAIERVAELEALLLAAKAKYAAIETVQLGTLREIDDLREEFDRMRATKWWRLRDRLAPMYRTLLRKPRV